jgi:hypothetical protein
MVTKDEIVALERGFWDAAGDGAFYREHFLDEGRCVFSMGVLDKDTTIKAVVQAAPWEDVALDATVLVELAPQVVALVYSARARREGQEPYEARISSVYVHRDGGWRLAVHQQTPVGVVQP